MCMFYITPCTLQGIDVRSFLIGLVRADAPDVYPLGMMGFLLWDVNSTDIGALFCSVLDRSLYKQSRYKPQPAMISVDLADTQ